MNVLLLLFNLDADQYALDVRHVIEVLPLVRITPVPQPPPGVAGLLNRRGLPVPVIDLTALIRGRASSARWSTRLVLVDYPVEAGQTRVLGLIAEHVTQTRRCAADDFVPSGLTTTHAPYLSRLATGPDGIVQLIDVSRLLSQPIRDVLFGAIPP